MEIKSITPMWKKLTWGDLDEWAGTRTVSRGKSYQRHGRVKGLIVSKSGILLATVQGGERYVTRVELDTTKRKRSERIVSKCSCPVGFACKHAVAVIVEFLEAIGEKREIAIAEEDDPRWSTIEGGIRGNDKIEDEWDEYDDDEPISRKNDAEYSKPARKRKRITNADIRSHLQSKSHDELVHLLMMIIARDDDARRALADETALGDGRFEELLHEAHEEIRSLTAEDAWCNSWTGEGHLPDYSGLEKRLQTLLDHGYADGIVTLGEELARCGIEQISRSQDEGETSDDIARCMEIVSQALLQSSCSSEEKILYAIDAIQADDYGVCDGMASVIDRPWKKSAWSAVADRLQKRLEDLTPPAKDRSDWSRTFRRRRLSDWVIDALDRAGRKGEATQLCIGEAERAGDYTQAVRRLMAEKLIGKAEQLAREGLKATLPEYAGIIHELQDLLCDIAIKNNDFKLPAAVAADRFFRNPDVHSYRKLLKAAEKAKIKHTVQKAALAFLETGKRPDRAKGDKLSTSWPLPAPPEPQARTSRISAPYTHNKPHFDVLIDLAIDQKRPDDVLKWFDLQKSSGAKAAQPWLSRTTRSDARIAKSVENTRPERAIAIYLQLADSIASETKPKTYPEAGSYLKRIRPLLKKTGQEGEWAAILEEFRKKHGRKPRLMQVIDGISGRPIVKGGKL